MTIFRSRVNNTVHKAFRSYTNPTAAHVLLTELGFLRIIAAFPEIEPVNQYLFSKSRDTKAIAARLKESGVDRRFRSIPKSVFPDGKLYHGTKTEQAFRSILFAGVLASIAGTAGDGLYGVDKKNIDFASHWGNDRTASCRSKSTQARRSSISDPAWEKSYSKAFNGTEPLRRSLRHRHPPLPVPTRGVRRQK